MKRFTLSLKRNPPVMGEEQELHHKFVSLYNALCFIQPDTILWDLFLNLKQRSLRYKDVALLMDQTDSTKLNSLLNDLLWIGFVTQTEDTVFSINTDLVETLRKTVQCLSGDRIEDMDSFSGYESSIIQSRKILAHLTQVTGFKLVTYLYVCPGTHKKTIQSLFCEYTSLPSVLRDLIRRGFINERQKQLSINARDYKVLCELAGAAASFVSIEPLVVRKKAANPVVVKEPKIKQDKVARKEPVPKKPDIAEDLLTRARELVASGMSLYAVSREIGVHPYKLKKHGLACRPARSKGFPITIKKVDGSLQHWSTSSALALDLGLAHPTVLNVVKGRYKTSKFEFVGYGNLTGADV